MDGQPLRIVTARKQILPAYLIPRGMGGTQEITSSVNGCITTGKIESVYEMSCGCKVSRLEECGAVCELCRAELEVMLATACLDEPLTPEQISCLAMPCKAHTFRCSYPFCARVSCLRHMAYTESGVLLCQPHFLERADQLDLQHSIAQSGIFLAKGLRFLRSLFLTD